MAAFGHVGSSLSPRELCKSAHIFFVFLKISKPVLMLPLHGSCDDCHNSQHPSLTLLRLGNVTLFFPITTYPLIRANLGKMGWSGFAGQSSDFGPDLALPPSAPQGCFPTCGTRRAAQPRLPQADAACGETRCSSSLPASQGPGMAWDPLGPVF